MAPHHDVKVDLNTEAIALRCDACGDQRILPMMAAQLWVDSHTMPRVAAVRISIDDGPFRWSKIGTPPNPETYGGTNG